MSDPGNQTLRKSTPGPTPETYPERALYDATSNNDLVRMKLILSTHPRQIHFEENSGLTPLEVAIWQGTIEAARLLIEHGADVNVKSPRGQTCLHIACGFGELDKVKLLVENGADINARTSEGSSPIHHAMMANRKKVAAYLKEKGAVLDPEDDATKDSVRIGKMWKGKL